MPFCSPLLHREISIHAPPRGATSCRRRYRKPKHFNSRPSARGDLFPMTFTAVPILFQFTPLREGRRESRGSRWCIQHFNSRPSARGDLNDAADALSLRYFNSRPSARGDRLPEYWYYSIYISIHAPPRGATHANNAEFRAFVFQFTPLREGRPPSGSPFFSPPISIHAPPRGATCRCPCPLPGLSYFNSRPSARGDSKRYAISANLLFNPYKSAWLNNRATQFVEIILVIFHRIIA